jgi:hypothetical protein
LLAGLAATAGAQRDSVPRAAPLDTSMMARPVTAARAEASGVKLLGVFDATTGDWISGATVRDTLGDEVATSALGIAALNVLSPLANQYMLEIRKQGYAPAHFKLRADTAAEFLVSLEPNPLGGTLLATTVVTAERKLVADPGLREGFIYRCGTGLLSCVGRADLDKHKTGYLDNFLDHVDGVERDCTALSDRTELAGRNAGAPPPAVHPGGSAASGSCPVRMIALAGFSHLCSPTFFVNGFEWSKLGGVSQSDLDQMLSAATIDGIEVYLPGHPAPQRFDSGALTGCGSVVIWTRGTKVPPLKHLPPPVVSDTAHKGSSR